MYQFRPDLLACHRQVPESLQIQHFGDVDLHLSWQFSEAERFSCDFDHLDCRFFREEASSTGDTRWSETAMRSSAFGQLINDKRPLADETCRTVRA